MQELYIQHIKYVTDMVGERKEVIIPFGIWKKITEEVEALRGKQEIFLGLKQACIEAKMQDEGKIPEQSLAGFLDEL